VIAVVRHIESFTSYLAHHSLHCPIGDLAIEETVSDTSDTSLQLITQLL
jgi:hypothetical protein